MAKVKTIRRKEREEIIAKIGGNPDVTGTTEMYKMRAMNSLFENLEDSIHKHSKSTNYLAVI